MDSELAHAYVRPTTRHSVLNVERQITNKVVGIIFIISFLLWLPAAIYGVAAPIEGTSIFHFENFDTARIFTLIGHILLNVGFTLVVFVALRWIPRISSVILLTFWLPVPIFIAASVRQTTFWSINLAVGSIFSCFLILILLKTEWLHLSEAVLKEACKMIVSVPSTVVFTLLAFLLNAFLLVIVVVATVNLMNGTSLFSMFLILIIIIFGVWILITVVALCWMTLSSTFAEYFYAENKSTVSFKIVWRLFAVNCRYHIGTAAMHHPLLGGLSALFYVAALGIKTILDGASKIKIFFFIYNIFDTVILRILFMGSAATCGIQGKNFYDSITHTMSLFLDNPKRFLIVIKVTELLMGLSGGLISLMITFSIYRYISDGFNESILLESLFVALVVLSGMVCVLTLLTCLKAAINSIILCIHDKMHMLGITESPDSCCIMPEKLQSALNHDGAPNWYRNSCCSCIPDFEYNPDP